MEKSRISAGRSALGLAITVLGFFGLGISLVGLILSRLRSGSFVIAFLATAVSLAAMVAGWKIGGTVSRSSAKTKAPSPSLDAVFTALIPAAARRQHVTYSLIVLNVLVYLVMVGYGVSILSPTAANGIQWGAAFGPLIRHGQAWRLFTSMFVHFGLIHLLFNMLALYSFGRWAESIFGGPLFLILYLVCGLSGNLLGLHMHPQIVSAGASGAILGAIGLLAGFLYWTGRNDHLPLLRQGRNQILLYVLYTLRGSGHGIDIAAHLGGLITGLMLGILCAVLRPEPSWLKAKDPNAVDSPGPNILVS